MLIALQLFSKSLFYFIIEHSNILIISLIYLLGKVSLIFTFFIFFLNFSPFIVYNRIFYTKITLILL